MSKRLCGRCWLCWLCWLPSPWLIMPDPTVRSLHHDLIDDHACSRPQDSLSPPHLFCFVSFLQAGKRSVFRETGSESLSPGVIAHRHNQGDLYIVKRLGFIGLSCFGPVLYFLDACSSQAEDVCPQRVQIALGCDGIGLFLHWLLTCDRLGCVPSFVRSILVPAVSPFFVLVSGCSQTWCSAY